jgi:LmbE family N-acetylglucosaminyl deacetylase
MIAYATTAETLKLHDISEMDAEAVPHPRPSAPARATRRLYQSVVAQRALLAVAHAHRWVLVKRARDVTDGVANRSCVVFAPHPDDEVLGCGGVVQAKAAAGAEVTVVVVTDGRYSHRSQAFSADELARIREQESRAACARLGIPPTNVSFWRLHETTTAEHAAALTERVADILRVLRPDEVFVPSGVDRLEDHRALNRSARAGIAAAGIPTTVYEYPIWYWHPEAWVHRGMGLRSLPAAVLGFAGALVTSRPVVVRIDAHRVAKRAALAEYRSQMEPLDPAGGWATMDPWFLALFTRREELFFELGAA